MLSYEQAGDVLDELADELPEEIFKNLNGGVSFMENAVCDEDGRYTLGMYFINKMGRHIELYYGSFVELYGAMDDDTFRLRLKNTLHHELTHHIESQAGDRSLERWDERQSELCGFNGIDVKSILFVCDDNSLSLVSEAVFNSSKLEYCPEVTAFSAGISAEEKINPRVTKCCESLGIRLPRSYAVSVSRELAEQCDVILCMTSLQAQKLSDEYQDLDDRIMCLADEDISSPILSIAWKKCIRRIEDETLAVIDELREENL
jgi:protein-tyrosine-phosphatase